MQSNSFTRLIHQQGTTRSPAGSRRKQKIAGGRRKWEKLRRDRMGTTGNSKHLGLPLGTVSPATLTRTGKPSGQKAAYITENRGKARQIAGQAVKQILVPKSDAQRSIITKYQYLVIKISEK